MESSAAIKYFVNRQRIILWSLAVVYIAVLDWMYVTWLSQQFDYMGFEYKKPGLINNIIIHVLAWLPILWIPLKLKRPSALIYWFVYLMVYIPAILLPFYISLTSASKLIELVTFLFFGMLIIGAFYILPVKAIKIVKIDHRFFWNSLFGITLLLTIYVIYIFKGNMRLVGLDDIYELRFAADDLFKNSLVGYAIVGLSCCFYPIFISYGLFKGSTLLILFGFAGQIMLYTTTGSKSNIFGGIIIVIIYLTVRKNTHKFGLKLLGALSLVILVVTLATLNATGTLKPIVFVIASILFMRTICMEGMLTAQYYHFFETHPYTYYTHINVLGKIFHYPYNDPLGLVIGYYYSGDDKFNENASFWMTDGIAAMGLPGILVISVLCGLVFWVLDCAAARHNIRFTATTVPLICLSILNVSLFTTLLSGGLLIMIVILILLPPVTNPTNNVAS